MSNIINIPEKALILAGGLGTRLRSVINDIPKPMSDINGKPFLSYLFDYILNQGAGIKELILSVGYKHERIMDYYGNKYGILNLKYVIEDKPLGTGGAIKNAINKFGWDNEILILNGDTFFNIDIKKLYEFHRNKNSNLTIALKKMENSDRYGFIEIDITGKIMKFLEKGHGHVMSGFINGGIYILNKSFLDNLDNIENPYPFSFEKDIIEKYYNYGKFYGINFNDCFIDIGAPEDYERAKAILKHFFI